MLSNLLQVLQDLVLVAIRPLQLLASLLGVSKLVSQTSWQDRHDIVFL